jgi:hypothetical protein
MSAPLSQQLGELRAFFADYKQHGVALAPQATAAFELTLSAMEKTARRLEGATEDALGLLELDAIAKRQAADAAAFALGGLKTRSAALSPALNAPAHPDLTNVVELRPGAPARMADEDTARAILNLIGQICASEHPEGGAA